MRNLGLGDILLGLRNLATERKADLLLSTTGKLYAPKLAKQQTQLEAVPEAMRGGRPLAQELAVKDEHHDGFGEAIHYYTEAIIRLPSAPQGLKDAAIRVRDAFVPKLGVLRASYANEAATAMRKRPLLDSLKADLQAIAVPHPAGATMLDWATAFIDAGDDIDKLLNDRSLVGTDTLGTPVLKIRTTTLGLLSRFRAALIDEIEEDTSLPRDLEARVFSYFDQLQKTRDEAAARRNKSEPAPTAETPGR
ncbi:MAG: hypothetical protein IPM54_19005 [Polyangiaceae bacterium]|nr:hypothetical protein [Polyangiaceae bacterium]